MANVKISDLPAASSAGGTDQLETNQGGTSRRLTVAQVATHVRSTATDTVVVAAGSAAAPSISPTGDSNTGMFFPAADEIGFAEGGVEVMRINGAGAVGIGTAVPGQKLEVAGGASQARIRVSGAGNPGYEFNGSDTAIVLGGANAMDCYTSGALRTRINSGGNFLVGTTSTFDVTSGATTQLSGQCAVFAAGSPNTIMSFYNSSQAARVGFIGSSGNSTSYNSGSDYRLKDNVTNISGAAAAVQSLRPVTFTWKISPETGTFSGFIAHELQEVWPEAVVGEKDAICDDGVTPNYQMVDQSKLVPLLTAALQEALTEIAALKARVAALEPAPAQA